MRENAQPTNDGCEVFPAIMQTGTAAVWNLCRSRVTSICALGLLFLEHDQSIKSMAGLLTDSSSGSFPTWNVSGVDFRKIGGASQQRVCTGLSPVSLLIHKA